MKEQLPNQPTITRREAIILGVTGSITAGLVLFDYYKMKIQPQREERRAEEQKTQSVKEHVIFSQ